MSNNTLSLPEKTSGALEVTRAAVDDDKPGQKTEVDVYLVQIERSNNEKISAEVYEFEIPVLEKVHGENAVRYNEGEPEFSVAFAGNAHDVLRVLQTKYNNTLIGDVVARVYRDAKELASAAGLPLPKGKASVQPQSENVDNRKKKA